MSLEDVHSDSDVNRATAPGRGDARFEATFEATFEHAAVGMAIVSLEGAWLRVNQALCNTVGYTREELSTLTFQHITHPDDLGPDLEYVRRMLAGDIQNYSLEKRYIKKDGQIVWIKLTVGLVHKADGAPDYFVSVVENITEQKRAEQELSRYRDHLEELVAVRTADLVAARAAAEVANMSHEIRTPMNAILGLTHLMLGEVHDGAMRDRLSKVDSAARHLLQLINDVLDLSKIEAGKMTLDERVFAPRELMADALEMVAEQARQKSIELVLDADGVPPRLMGDPMRLRQMLLNLLANAIKFTDRGWVRLSACVVGEQGGRLKVRFDVTDTGLGITPEQRERLFGDFEQVDASPLRRSMGTGLGLALTRRFAQLMGGETGVDSVYGRGSTFWFGVWLAGADPVCEVDRLAPLPRIESLAEARAHAAGHAREVLRAAHAGQRVLLAEDNPVNREVACELMRAAGLQVDTAQDGAQVVEMAKAGRYDLIVMDLQMPVLNGISAAQRIRAQQGVGVPILAVTANAFNEDRQACLAAGMNDFVSKPVDPPMFYAALNRLLPARGAAHGEAPPEAGADADAALVAAGVGWRQAHRTGERFWQGLDLDLALRNVGGSTDALQRVLGAFAQMYRSGVPELQQPDGPDLLNRWRSASHSLRGSCGAIGALVLQCHVREFERQLDGRMSAAALATQARQLDDELRQLVAAIANSLEDEPVRA